MQSVQLIAKREGDYWVLGFLSGLFERDNRVVFIETPYFLHLHVFESLSTDQGRVKLGKLDDVALEFRKKCEKILSQKDNCVIDLLGQAVAKLKSQPKSEMKRAASRCIKDAMTVLRLENRKGAKIRVRSERELLETESLG
jgi:hypothetical protein